MPLTDLPLSELRTYSPDVAEPADFDDFWSRTLADTRTHGIGARFTAVAQPLRLLESYDVTFAGFGGDPVKGWLHLPRHRGPEPLACVVEYLGYGGGRGLVHDRVFWATAGYAHFVMDSRGQGSGWLTGDTPDPHGSGPSTGAFITRGIEDPDSYYFRRLITDAVRAVEAAAEHPAIDASRISVAGGSQGGALTLAAAGLLGDKVAAAVPDVPFLCHVRRAVDICDENPYKEVAAYLKARRDVDTVFQTLSYVDCVNFAKRATAPALFGIAMMDEVCPPSTCFAAYNAYVGDKDVRVYEFNDHEGGQGFFLADSLTWLATTLNA
ncbi:MAG: putative esterase [Frankiales bacterium]|nr:putative esterase [Frankiales bacterium]